MSAPRRLAAIPIIGAALTLSAFGVVRGISNVGPAHGTRLIVTIEPPVDADAQKMAEHVARERLTEKGTEVRVVPAGGQLVVELGGDDPQIVDELASLLERTAKLELHIVDSANPWLAKVVALAGPREGDVRVEAGTLAADDRWDDLPVAEADAVGCAGRVEDGKRHCLRRGDALLAVYVRALAARDPSFAAPDDRMIAYGRVEGHQMWRVYVLEREPILEGRMIKDAELVDRGVAIRVADASTLARVKTGVPVAFVFDGGVKAVAVPDPIVGTVLHVPTTGATEDAAIVAAFELVAVIEAGAVHSLHVGHRETFRRATGFVPRAWPFLAAGAVLLLAAAILWWRRSAAAG